MNEIYYKQKVKKLDKAGKAPIFLEFNHDACTLVYATGEKCTIDQWNPETQKFRRSMPGYQQANESLQMLRERLTAAYRKLRDTGQPVTSDQLRAQLRPNQKQSTTTDLPTLYVDYLTHCKSINYKPATLKSMGVTGGRLRGFVKSAGKLSVSDYTVDSHARFLRYLTDDLQLHPNSVANTNKHLRAFFNWCRLRTIQLHPQHATIKTEWSESERIYLTLDELKQLETAELSIAMARVRDAFLFQCYTGLRYAELSRLDHSHIEQRSGYRVLTFIAEKSVSVRARRAKRVEVPILPGAEMILTRYAGDYRLLPVLSNQKYNDYIKEIAKTAKINTVVEQVSYEKGTPTLISVPKHELVSSHIARHTYATVSLILGVPLEVVSKSLGHSDLKTTMIYAKIADEWKNQTILNAWKQPNTSTLQGDQK